MKKVLAFVFPVAVGALLSSCGDTCSSTPAKAEALPSTCSLSPGGSRTIQVRLCAKCSDSNPSCVGEYRNGVIELDTAFQECQADAGCSTSSGCDPMNSKVNCQVDIPASAPGTVQIQAGSNMQVSQATIASNGGTSCMF